VLTNDLDLWRWTTMRWLRITLPVVALMFSLAACGGDGTEDKPAEKSAETQELLLKYAQCMRDNGVQLPDPKEGDPGSMYEGVDRNAPAFQSADAVCGPILQGVVADRQEQGGEQQQDDMLALAQCLRDHGIDVKDPVPGAEKPFGDSLDRTDPAVATALQECADAAPEPVG
jgi:predicted small lipoprotein YifL